MTMRPILLLPALLLLRTSAGINAPCFTVARKGVHRSIGPTTGKHIVAGERLPELDQHLSDPEESGKYHYY